MHTCVFLFHSYAILVLKNKINIAVVETFTKPKVMIFFSIVNNTYLHYHSFVSLSTSATTNFVLKKVLVLRERKLEL